jgi:hypothetical protein
MTFLILFHFHFIILFFHLSFLFFSFPCSILTLYLPFPCPLASCCNIWSRIFFLSFVSSFLFFIFCFYVSWSKMFLLYFCLFGCRFKVWINKTITFFFRYVLFHYYIKKSLLFALYFISSFWFFLKFWKNVFYYISLCLFHCFHFYFYFFWFMFVSCFSFFLFFFFFNLFLCVFCFLFLIFFFKSFWF